MNKQINLCGRCMLLSKLIFMFVTILISCFSIIFDICYIGIIFNIIFFSLYVYFYQGEDIFVVKWITVCLACTNFVIGLISYHFGNGTSSLMHMTQLPTIYIYLLPTVYLLKRKKLIVKEVLELLFISILAICGIYLLFYSYKNLGSINYFRNFTMFGFIFLIGKYLINNKEKISDYGKFVVNMSIVLVLIGVILYFCDYKVYEFLGMQNVYIAKGAVFKTDGFDDRFTTTLISYQFFRMGSILYEPINLGYFLIIPVIITFFKIRENKINIIKLAIVGGGLILTFGKGAYLLLAATMGAWLIYKICRLKFENNTTCFFISLLVMFVFVLSFTLFYAENIGSAAATHFIAIIKTFESLKGNFMFGKGLGSGGNYGAQLDGWLESGGETGLMSMVYQMGLIFTLLVMLFFAILSYKNIKRAKTEIGIALSFLPIFTIMIYIYQENTFAPQCIFLIMLMCGAMQSKKGVISDENLLSWK